MCCAWGINHATVRMDLVEDLASQALDHTHLPIKILPSIDPKCLLCLFLRFIQATPAISKTAIRRRLSRGK